MGVDQRSKPEMAGTSRTGLYSYIWGEGGRLFCVAKSPVDCFLEGSMGSIKCGAIEGWRCITRLGGCEWSLKWPR